MSRLDGVRKELLRSGAKLKIADTANNWGFWHVGQFAADYRRHFGELPSQTLDRVRSCLQ
ncbi:MAG: helix-turn-helix domain-containing protein [bacterium]|nr:helix-turn-helix domain-containing protein [bacterium]